MSEKKHKWGVRFPLSFYFIVLLALFVLLFALKNETHFIYLIQRLIHVGPRRECLLKKWRKTFKNKKHYQIKLQHFRKVWIETFGWLVHEINSLYKILKLKQNFRKEKVTSKTPLFVIGSFCAPHSICLNIGFSQSSFVWKCCVFNLSTFSTFWKRSKFPVTFT